MTRPAKSRHRSGRARPRLGACALVLMLVAAPGLAAEEPETARPGAATAERDEEAERPPVERITFTLPFEDETGGGTAKGSAGELEYLRNDYVVASGAVEVAYQALKVQAEKVEIDLATKQVTAEGNVILDEGPRRLTGASLAFDLESKTGTLYEGRAYVDPDVVLEGAEIAKLGDQVYTVKDGTITSCTEDRVPDWSFRLGRARVNVEGFARVRNARMRAKKLPFLYTPYIMFPAKSERASGILFPQFGYSSRRGEELTLAYFQTLGRSYDTTFFVDLYGKSYLGLGNEFRYRPSQATTGISRLLVIDDPDAPSERWKASLIHSSEDLPKGLRGVVRYIDYSDFNFFRDFERDFDEIAVRTIWSSGFLTGNWGPHGFNLLIDDRETFINDEVSVVQRQLPEVEYRLRPTRLFGAAPIYFELLSSANLFEVGRTDLLSETYSRADLAPTLRVPLSYWPWLSVSVDLAGRATFYENSLTADKQAFSGESLTRTFPSASVDIIGPSFSRIFDKKLGRFGKFKHIIEPRWAYLFVGEFDEQELVPLFDEVDTLTNQRVAALSITNRLLAKPADEDLSSETREILSLEIGQFYSLDDTQVIQSSRDGTRTTTDGPLSMALRFNPSLSTNWEARLNYSTLFDAFDSASLLGSTRLGRHLVGLGWFGRLSPELDQTTSHQARLNTDLVLVANRLRLNSTVSYDFVNSLLQHNRHILYYTSQCWGVALEFRESRTRLEKQTDFRLSVSLKNIGTFLDLTTGSNSAY